MPFYINMDSETFHEIFGDDLRASNFLKILKEDLHDVVEDKEDVDDCVSKHGVILNVLHDIYKEKNADYGNSFHETFAEEGLAMARIRLTDKLNRFKNLTKDNEQHVEDESVLDTLYDMANYAIMTIMELTAWSDEENENDE